MTNLTANLCFMKTGQNWKKDTLSRLRYEIKKASQEKSYHKKMWVEARKKYGWHSNSAVRHAFSYAEWQHRVTQAKNELDLFRKENGL